MSEYATRWLISIVIFLVIEGLLIWKIRKTFRLGTISFEPIFWLSSDSSLQAAARAADFKMTAPRAAHPVFFWLLTGIVVAFAIVVAALFVALAVYLY